MPDFPGSALEIPHINLNTTGPNSPLGQAASYVGNTFSTAVWPAANRAIYVPVQVDIPVTVLQMAFLVGVQSGNYDIGIYDEHGNRLVSKGSTAVPVAGLATADITDTALMPGVYFLALCVDNITASIVRTSISASVLEACGVQNQDVGAVTLPDPATFVNPITGLAPALVATAVATI